MSGGRLVVVDRSGRDGKIYPLPDGLVTLGSDTRCDIRVMLHTVSAHHATVVVHTNQTVVRSVSDGETLVNGHPVSVAALKDGDIITLGDRSLRWEYSDPTASRPLASQPALYVRGRKPRAPQRRATEHTTLRRDAALQLTLEMSHRASMPSGGKQVAIVQPQRRDANYTNDTSLRSVAKPQRPNPPPKRQRTPKSHADTSITETGSDKKRKSNSINLQNTTKATLWIESRKSSPRKSIKSPPQVKVPTPRRSMASVKKNTPLRMAVLRKAMTPNVRNIPRDSGRKVQSAQKTRVTKIEDPLKLDHTKQAAINLMTGHTPKSRPPGTKDKTPSYVIKKPSPVRKTPRSQGKKSKGRNAKGSSINIRTTPKHSNIFANTSRRCSKRLTAGQSVSVLEITDSDAHQSTVRESNLRSRPRSPQSPLLQSPKKSALKDPKSKKSFRKTESIKFDLSNLENRPQDEFSYTFSDTTKSQSDDIISDDITLRYSDTSTPSPRRPIHSSRSSKILQQTLGKTIKSPGYERNTVTESPSPGARKSLRSSLILQKALETPNTIETSAKLSRRTTKTIDQSGNTSVATAFRTRTLSPRTSNQNNMEAYSIVDLVSVDSSQSDRTSSIYNSVGSSSFAFQTPQNRTTRSTIDPVLLGSSTPYVDNKKLSTRRSRSDPTISSKSLSRLEDSISRRSKRSSGNSRRSKSLTTPENSEEIQKHISINSTKISRASKCRSRIDSEIQFMSLRYNDGDGDSPKSSRRISQNKSSVSQSSPNTRNTRNSTLNFATENITQNINSPINQGTITPENRHSPEEAGTPVLNMQSLLDSSYSYSAKKSPKIRANLKRKTIEVPHIGSKKGRLSVHSKCLNISGRKTLTFRGDSDESSPQSEEKIVTPKSTVQPSPESVKNKHSTAKKPHSKRSLIDNLDESDIIKQLFSSPVKRKLSQSMMEFSRKQLFDDVDVPRRPTRNTVALTGRTPNNSLLEPTGKFTPERFVSPLTTPSESPNMSGVTRFFRNNTPENVLRKPRDVKSLLRTPTTRKVVKDDLTNVSGVKLVFRSPRSRLSDVGVKELFGASPNNDLQRVSAVKYLFQSQGISPKNDLSDVRGVKKLFKGRSPRNDLRDVSGVKKTLQSRSPKNDLSDVRGVRSLFRQREQRDSLIDLSGVEELFNESNQSRRDVSNTESLFDRLLGKPPIKATYSKSFTKKSTRKSRQKRNAKSFHIPVDVIMNNVEEWLEEELKKRLHKDSTASTSKDKQVFNRSKTTTNVNISRALQQLATDTVEGNTPLRKSRVRNSTIAKNSIQTSGQKSATDLYDAHTLPIKKRSLIKESLENTRNVNKSNKLPIKKRSLMHSTPVKGKLNISVNVSELGRVSPIVSEQTRSIDNNTSLGSIQLRESPQQKTAKGRRASKSKVTENTKVRTTRARKSNTLTEVLNTKRRKSSIVICKKSPALKPKSASRKEKPITKQNQKEEYNTLKISSNKRVARGKPQREFEEKQISPRNTRTKVKKTTVVITKPSPLSKRAKQTRTKNVEIVETQPTTRGRRSVVSKNITEVISKISRKPVEDAPVKAVIKKVDPDVSERKMKRGRKPARPTNKPSTSVAKAVSPKKTRATRKTVIEESNIASVEPKTKRIRKTAPQSTPEKKLRGRKTGTELKQPESIPEKPIRGRKNNVPEPQKNVESGNKEPVKRGRSRKAEVKVDFLPERRTRGKNAKIETESQPKRGRETAQVQDTVPNDAKQRGRRNVENAKTKKVNSPKISESVTRRGVNKDVQKIDISVKNVRRGRRTDAKVTASTSEVTETGLTTRRGKSASEVAELKAFNVRQKTVTLENKAESTSRAKKVITGKLIVEKTDLQTKSQHVKERPVRGRKAIAVAESAPTRGRKRNLAEAPVAEALVNSPARKRPRKATANDTTANVVCNNTNQKQRTIKRPVPKTTRKAAASEIVENVAHSTRGNATQQRGAGAAGGRGARRR